MRLYSNIRAKLVLLTCEQNYNQVSTPYTDANLFVHPLEKNRLYLLVKSLYVDPDIDAILKSSWGVG